MHDYLRLNEFMKFNYNHTSATVGVTAGEVSILKLQVLMKSAAFVLTYRVYCHPITFDVFRLHDDNS